MNDNYQAMEDAFREDTYANGSNAELAQHLHALANKSILNDAVHHRDIIRGLTINQLLTQRHIDFLDKSNKTTQRLVMVLALMSVVASLPQIWFAYRADIRESGPPLSSAVPPAAPSLTKPVAPSSKTATP